MDDLITFVRTALDRVERVALAARGDSCSRGDWLVERPGFGAAIRTDDGDVVVYDEGAPSEDQIEHITLHDPASALADVKAKRMIMDEHFEESLPDGVTAGLCTSCMNHSWPCRTMRALAQAYAGWEGWQEDWRT